MPHLDGLYLAVAFCGGMFGAAVGGLPSFILCGCALITGSIIALVTGDSSFNNLVTWGPFLGPHVTFAGGVAAAALASRKGRLESGRNILFPLIRFRSPLVLVTGGIFGVVGCILAWGMTLIPSMKGIPWTNPIALSIAINTLIVRLVLGRTGILGAVSNRAGRWVPDEEKTSFPSHISPPLLLAVTAAVSLPVAFVTRVIPQSQEILFGTSIVALVLPVIVFKVPLLFHVVLAAELGSADGSALGWGVTFAFLAAVLTEIFACLFLVHGDTHVDPPAMALSVVCSLYPLLTFVGVLSTPGSWSVLIAGAVAFSGYALLSTLRRSHERRNLA